jgi:hypothetical protein
MFGAVLAGIGGVALAPRGVLSRRIPLTWAFLHQMKFYCSPKCQKDDWTRHRAVCRPELRPGDLIRMHGLVRGSRSHKTRPATQCNRTRQSWNHRDASVTHQSNVTPAPARVSGLGNIYTTQCDVLLVHRWFLRRACPSSTEWCSNSEARRTTRQLLRLTR